MAPDGSMDTFHLVLGGIKQAGNVGTAVWWEQRLLSRRGP